MDGSGDDAVARWVLVSCCRPPQSASDRSKLAPNTMLTHHPQAISYILPATFRLSGDVIVNSVRGY